MNKLSLIICMLFLGALIATPVFAGDKAPYSGSNEEMTTPQGASNPGWRMNSEREHAVTPGGAGMMSSTESFGINGKKVVSSQGEDLGSVKDVIVGSNGRVDYIIVSHGGALGFGDKLTPVPWNMVTGTEGDTITLNVTKDRLAQAPTIPSGEYAQFNTPEWNRKVHGYYGQDYNGTSGFMPGMSDRPGMQQERNRMMND